MADNDPLNRIHERIDDLMGVIGELGNQVSAIDERTKNQSTYMKLICNKINKNTDKINQIEREFTVCKAENSSHNKGLIKGGIVTIKQHPVITALAIVIAIIQILRESGVL